jgi:dihydroflavonol-4-reductase
MPTALITGATGFVGRHVARVLMDRGWRLHALRRPGPRRFLMHAPGLQWYEGDVKSHRDVTRAMEGCDAVFHVAADYRLWSDRPREIYENNVDGTDVILDAAFHNRVERVVYTSTVGALGLRGNGMPSDETTPVSLGDMVGHYKRSKYLAERKAEEYLHRGLPLVMVHPSTPVGPLDHKPTPTGKIIVDFLNGRIPAYLETGLNLIHVDDVAQGHLLAYERGKVGEKYILGNQNVTLADMFRILEKISGKKAPRIRLPYLPILMLATVEHWLSRLTHSEPLVALEGVKMAKRFMFFNPQKAVRELGLPQTPVQRALAEAVEWFVAHGYVKCGLSPTPDTSV